MRKLFQPIKIGSLELKNRLVMLPMATNYATSEGYVTETLKNYYVERAKGGVGLIIVEATCVDAPVGKLARNMLCIDDDKFIPGLEELAKAVKRHGMKIAIQLNHAGSIARSAITGVRPVSASGIPIFPGMETPRELTTEEVEEIVEKHGEGARRAKEAGFDAVEIETGFYYLLGQFLSSARNFRKDKYGGDFEGRIRFTLEILESIRGKVGDSYPISCKLVAPVEGIESEEEMDEILRRIEGAGANLLHRGGKSPIVQMNGHGVLSLARPIRVPCGYAVDLAERTKQVVGIPVVAVGRINSPDLAERILQEGKADLIGLGRALLADPEFPRKAFEGKLDDIRACIACCRGCISRVGVNYYVSEGIMCTVNPALGREEELRIIPAAKGKSVLVIGGGPAGMEAARVAALRGHKIQLYERKSELGGQLLLAATPPEKSEIKGLISYLKTQIEKLGVEINLGEQVTSSMVEDMKPDAVIVATGARPLIPSIPGIHGVKVVTAFDVLEGKARTGENVAIVGGGVSGCETAEYLAQEHKKVTITIIEMLKEIAADDVPVSRFYLLQSLREKGVRMLTEMKVEEITEEGLTVRAPSGEKETIEADTVVIATGLEPNKELARELREKAFAVYSVGDCVEPRKIMEAMHEGYTIALKL